MKITMNVSYRSECLKDVNSEDRKVKKKLAETDLLNLLSGDSSKNSPFTLLKICSELVEHEGILSYLCQLSLRNWGNLKQAKIEKYWSQRYSLWTRYDDGILMDKEGWFSVTPEKLAIHHADRLSCDIIADAFSGVGGNSIQFANTCHQVISIDNNFERLLLAKHNADVYKVGHKIDYICGDFMVLARALKVDAVFLSPPWGGPAYHKKKVFDLETSLGGLDINYCQLITVANLALFSGLIGNTDAQIKSRSSIACFLPKSSDINYISNVFNLNDVEIEQNFISNNLKSITVYYGKCLMRKVN